MHDVNVHDDRSLDLDIFDSYGKAQNNLFITKDIEV